MESEKIKKFKEMYLKPREAVGYTPKWRVLYWKCCCRLITFLRRRGIKIPFKLWMLRIKYWNKLRDAYDNDVAYFRESKVGGQGPKRGDYSE